MKKISILIVDDHKLLRETWSYILKHEHAFDVVAECESAEEAILKVKDLRPDIVTMDINLPGISGIEAIQTILDFSPQTKVLGVSLHSQPSYARQMLHRGALGYVTKNSRKEELIYAIKEINAGRKFICAEVKDIIAKKVMGNEDDNESGPFSRREIEILRLIKRGYSSKQIGAALHIALKTVESHRYNMLKKLALKNTAELINFIKKNYSDIV